MAARLSVLLRRWEPRIVYAPSRVDFHPEHQRVAHALAQALAASSAEGDGPVIRVIQIQVPLGAALVNRVVDIATVDATYRDAVEAHASQRGSILRCMRLKRYAARAHRLSGLAEEFWELPAHAYSLLHRETPERWQGRFRGVRDLSVTDPAAYLVGRTPRQRFRAMTYNRGSSA